MSNQVRVFRNEFRKCAENFKFLKKITEISVVVLYWGKNLWGVYKTFSQNS